MTSVHTSLHFYQIEVELTKKQISSYYILTYTRKMCFTSKLKVDKKQILELLGNYVEKI